MKATETVRPSAPTASAKTRCASSRAKRGGILWGTLAAVTCPCHLPILAVVLSGTALGAQLQEHFTLTLVLFSVLFLLSLWAVARALSATAPGDT
jgi:mercuric ion transport protein